MTGNETISSNNNSPRLLGAAFLIVLFTSAVSNALLASVAVSGGSGAMLVNISENLTLLRISSLLELVTSLGIVVLAVLLYAVLHKQNNIIALVALGWWLAEAITLAVSKMGAYALIPLSLDFVKLGAPDPSYHQSLAEFFYYGLDRLGNDIHMVFYCMGGILWFYLFYRSRYIPRLLSVWALAGVSIGLIGIVISFFGVKVNTVIFAQIALYELVIGVWLLVKGIDSDL